jgi:SAM-dependent methyltransferase
MERPAQDSAEFDTYASNYDEALTRGISVSGENKEYFSRGRIAWLAGCLRELDQRPVSMMDYGCGTGSATPALHDLLTVKTVVGVDVSAESLDIARRTYDAYAVRFLPIADYEPDGRLDLAFCNGVFHHIPVDQRAAALDFVYRSLQPGGLFALWENNPWNPGTRYVMSRIPFDRDAVTLTPPETRRLVIANGFEVLRTDFLFFFPALLRWCRPVEPLIAKVPFGAQYQVLCRKPPSRDS